MATIRRVIQLHSSGTATPPMLLLIRTILIYGCPPHPPIVRLRNPGSPHRAFLSFSVTRLSPPIDRTAPALGTDQPLAPVGDGGLGAVSFGHLGGIGTCATFGGAK